MGVYVHFTDEQKYRANNVDLVDFLQRHGEKLIPSGRDKRLASDRSITVRGNEWYDHSAETGGYAIDFVRNFYGLTFPEAVTMLLGGEQGEIYRPASQKKHEAKQPFALPNPHSDMRRVYAYLVKTRFIDREVVNYFARAKLLYESCEKSKDGKKEYHNAVFVGYDENGVPRHAHKRGLYTQGAGFKGNVDSCDPAYSFHHIGTSNRLYVFEAPIDLLSYITLHPQNWQNYSYVALCGVSEYAMLKMLELHPHLNHVVLCLDHDEAGIEASEKYQDLLSEKGIPCERELSIHKDWNEDIKANYGLPAIPAEEHPQHLIRDEICRELTETVMEMKDNCSADTLSALLTKTRSHLYRGQFSEADDCLREMCSLSVAAAARGYQQMNHSRNLTAVQTRLHDGFRAYENRGHLKTRLDLLESSILSLRKFEGVVTASEKEKLAECYEQIAAHCLKGAILTEKHRQKMEQSQEMKLSM
ncbi:DUF3991 and toprim domain-containing protein [Erysipelothrix anatis]|uniref:DUF3991 and toprim domain-containing protein n=1 Tax=Erysipelothrix anatis TaxID=2683713 RepID=UPI00140921CF|nr:DUF3991 and toprim domain-containing protein [Erysipelothrix anatis]